MTIKNTKRNISDEEGLVLIDAEKNTLTINQTTKNFNESFELTFSFQDWENEDFWELRQANDYYKKGIEGEEDRSYLWNVNKKAYIKKLSLPTQDLVRLAHLVQEYYNKTYINENYYTKTEVDNKIKLHFYVWGSTTPPTVAQVKALVTNNTIQSYDNYIFLVPFSGNNYNDDNTDETFQEGGYREFVYVKKNDDTEAMEEVGSIKLDLTPYLKIALLDDKLYELSGNNSNYQKTNNTTHYKKVVDQVQTNKININKKVNIEQSDANHFVVTDSSKNIKTQGSIGNIKIDGILYSGTTPQKNKLLTTNNSTGLIEGVDYLTTARIRSSSTLSGQISATANTTTQDTINSSINTKLGDLNNKFSNYLLLSDIKKEIWGEAPNRMAAKQALENSNDAQSNYKLGDYIHYILYDSEEFYKASDIDDLITGAINIQNNTLGML